MRLHARLVLSRRRERPGRPGSTGVDTATESWPWFPATTSTEILPRWSTTSSRSRRTPRSWMPAGRTTSTSWPSRRRPSRAPRPDVRDRPDRPGRFGRERRRTRPGRGRREPVRLRHPLSPRPTNPGSNQRVGRRVVRAWRRSESGPAVRLGGRDGSRDLDADGVWRPTPAASTPTRPPARRPPQSPRSRSPRWTPVEPRRTPRQTPRRSSRWRARRRTRPRRRSCPAESRSTPPA